MQKLAILFCLISTPALAASEWDCLFTDLHSQPGGTAHATIRIEGKKLEWIVDGFDVPGSGNQVPASSFSYTVLEDNDFGLVAVSPRMKIDKDAGPIIGSGTIALDKKNGQFRSGTVLTNGVHDNLNGTCKVK